MGIRGQVTEVRQVYRVHVLCLIQWLILVGNWQSWLGFGTGRSGVTLLQFLVRWCILWLVIITRWIHNMLNLVRLFRRLYVDVVISELLLSSLLFLGDELDLSTLVLGLVLWTTHRLVDTCRLLNTQCTLPALAWFSQRNIALLAVSQRRIWWQMHIIIRLLFD